MNSPSEVLAIHGTSYSKNLTVLTAHSFDRESSQHKDQIRIASRWSGRRCQTSLALTGRQLIRLLTTDGWELKRRSNHGLFLTKRFGDRTRTTVVKNTGRVIPNGTLSAIGRDGWARNGVIGAIIRTRPIIDSPQTFESMFPDCHAWFSLLENSIMAAMVLNLNRSMSSHTLRMGLSSQGRSPDNDRTGCSNVRRWSSAAAKTRWPSLGRGLPTCSLD